MEVPDHIDFPLLGSVLGSSPPSDSRAVKISLLQDAGCFTDLMVS
jgi:hypothetical protein